MTTATETVRAPARTASRTRRLRKNRYGRFLVRIPFWILIAAIFIYALFPFYWVIRSSFTPEVNLFQTPVKYIPTHPTLENYRGALSASFFQDALLNSAIVAGSVTILSLVIGSFAA